MKKYMIVPAPFLFTLLFVGLIWSIAAAGDTILSIAAAGDTAHPQQEIRDPGTQQSQDLQNDYKPTEKEKVGLLEVYLLTGSIVSVMFLTTLITYDVWEGVRRRQLRKIYNQLEKER